MGEWISVKDRLPKEGVLAIIVNENDCIDIAYLCGGKWKVCDSEYRITPTHWIPFPNFPET